MKKIIVSLVLAALLLLTVIPFAASAANGTTTVRIVPSTATVCPGQSITLSVIIEGNPGFKGFNINLAKPAGFTVQQIIPSTMIGTSATVNTTEVLVNCANANVVTSDGVLFTVVLVADANVTASVMQFGFDSVRMSDANKLSITTNNVPATVMAGHSFTNYVSNNDATCTADGTKTATCTCGAKDTIADVNSKLPHTYNYVSNNDATCFADGTKTGTCVCGDKVTVADEGTKLTHKFTQYNSDNNATCTADGTKTAVCDNGCGTKDTIADADSKLQHKDEDNDGKCDDCQYPVIGCAHPKTATRIIIVTSATCDQPGAGFTMLYCTVCGQTISSFPMTIPASHTDEDADGKCDVCGTAMVEHVHVLEYTAAKEATCFEEGNLEYWYCAGCDCYFTDAEGKYNIARLSLITPVAHDIVHVEAKEPTATENGNIEYWYCTKCGYAWLDEYCTKNTNLKAVILPATGEPEHVHELVHTEAKAATCFEEGNLEYWYCAGCDCYFTDAEGKYNIARLSLITPVAHKVEHVEAKEATCFETGNIEYWYCTECGYAWLDELCTKNTNLKAVILPVTHKVEHVAAVAPTCFETGNIEYWYCTECGYAWLDELCTKNTNLKAVVLPVSHKIEHVPAVAPTVTENGNIEYWYCTECGYAWLDELCTKNTNLKAVILPATGEVINPPTGDNAIFCAVALAVIATLGVAVVSYKKREEN